MLQYFSLLAKFFEGKKKKSLNIFSDCLNSYEESTSQCDYCKAQEEVDPYELNTSNLSNDMGLGWDDEQIKESNVDNETLSNQDSILRYEDSTAASTSKSRTNV